jgi:hypothetical protein
MGLRRGMKIIFNEEDGFKRIHPGSSTGFYKDALGELYLVHLQGVSKLQVTGGTLTFGIDELQTPLKKFKTGDKLTIEF